MDTNSAAIAAWTGFGTSLFIVVFCFWMLETICEEEHNVFDCEWSQSPFTPVIPEKGGE